MAGTFTETEEKLGKDGKRRRHIVAQAEPSNRRDWKFPKVDNDQIEKTNHQYQSHKLRCKI
jgi:predicted DNA-binding ArsR family transcriptional regulator